MISRGKLANTNQLNRILLYLNKEKILKKRKEITVGTAINSEHLNNGLLFLEKTNLIIKIKEGHLFYYGVGEANDLIRHDASSGEER